MAIGHINLNNPFGIAGSASGQATTIEKQQVEQRQCETRQQQSQHSQPNKPATFGEAAVAYLRHKDNQAAKAKGQDQASVLQQVSQQLGKPLSQVTPQDVQRFLQQKAQEEQQQAQQNQSFQALAPQQPKQLGEVVAALLNMFDELNNADDDDSDDVNAIVVGEDISDAEKFDIEGFLTKNGLNEYGDPVGTTYDQPPTFDPQTGDYKSRYALLAEKFENRPWK